MTAKKMYIFPKVLFFLAAELFLSASFFMCLIDISSAW